MSDNLSQEMTIEEVRAANEAWCEKMASDNPQMVKQAESTINDYTRTRVREDGIWRRVMPVQPIADSELDRAVDTDEPIKIIDREPDSPGSITIPFAGLPNNLYIKGERYKCHFARVVTPRFTKDFDQLRTYHMDIRQVLSDNSIKDMLAEEDSKFISAVNTALVGPNLVTPTSGTVQHQVIPGGITRDSLWDSMEIMPSTPSCLEVHTALINNITIKRVCKLTRNEMGGNLAEELMRNGWTLSNFMGVDWIITIKKGLVPTNTIYYFADPKFIGKAFSLVDTTMYVKREAYMLEFFAYETIGGAIGWTSGLARVDFQG
jgi:hypothetical protein